MSRPGKPRSRRYVVTVDVPRSDGWRSWSAAAGAFGERLAAQAAPPVLAAGIDTETRRGPDYVRIRIMMTIEAADVAGAITLAWEAFRTAAGDPGAWDLAVAAASARPADGLLGLANCGENVVRVLHVALGDHRPATGHRRQQVHRPAVVADGAANCLAVHGHRELAVAGAFCQPGGQLRVHRGRVSADQRPADGGLARRR